MPTFHLTIKLFEPIVSSAVWLILPGEDTETNQLCLLRRTQCQLWGRAECIITSSSGIWSLSGTFSLVCSTSQGTKQSARFLWRLECVLRSHTHTTQTRASMQTHTHTHTPSQLGRHHSSTPNLSPLPTPLTLKTNMVKITYWLRRTLINRSLSPRCGKSPPEQEGKTLGNGSQSGEWRGKPQ